MSTSAAMCTDVVKPWLFILTNNILLDFYTATRSSASSSASLGEYEYYPLYYNDLHIHVDEFQGRAVIHIWERLSNGHFARSGITLDEEEYKDMMALGSSVLEALRNLVARPSDVEDTWSRSIGSRGRRVVVSHFRGQGYVNIRNY